MAHPHDGTVLQVSAEEASEIVASWPSVAKCTADGRAGHISVDEDACDHDNRMRHNHDGTVGSSDAPNPRFRNPLD